MKKLYDDQITNEMLISEEGGLFQSVLLAIKICRAQIHDEESVVDQPAFNALKAVAEGMTSDNLSEQE